MLVTHKHIAYNDSSYSSIYWQGVIIPDVPCDNLFDGVWSITDANYYWRVILSYIDAPVGTVITVNGVPYPVSGSGEVVHDVGKATAGNHTTVHLLCGPGGSGCDEENPCPDGEKCVDGECQPCDEQQATHFQIRFEYNELATDSLSNQSMYHYSSIIPIASSEGLVIQGTEINQPTYYPRIRFCDASGSIKPYTGTFSLYGFCTPDKSTALYPFNGSLSESSTFLGPESSTDAVTNNPWFIPRVLVNHIDVSGVILETDCSDVVPVEPPPIEPVEPDQPDEPDEPEEPLPPDTIEEPLPPSGPQPPQEGLCPCEEYIGRQIGRAADILYSGLIALKRELAQGFREIVIELWEKRKLDYQLSMFLQNQQFQIMQAQHLRLYEIRQTLDVIRDDIKKGLVEGDDGLIDIVKTGLQEGDKGLVDFVKDFTEQYEPVTIENEYRTQSHRVIDNLDEVVNKL